MKIVGIKSLLSLIVYLYIVYILNAYPFKPLRKL